MTAYINKQMHFLYCVQLENFKRKKVKKQQKTTTCELNFIIYYFFHMSEQSMLFIKNKLQCRYR